MAKDKLTIRFTPDGFSFAECPDTASILLDDAPFVEVAPGPDSALRLREQIISMISQEDAVRDVTCQFVSTRVILLPSDITDLETASAMYSFTLGKDETEQVVTQQLSIATGQEITLCFGINRELYNFLIRNFGEVCFEHHMATLLTQGARMASGNCMVVRCDRQMLELVLFRQGKVDILNAYRTSQADNRAYYIMNTWLQQNLDQLQDNLLVLSQNTESLQIRASLHRFIKHVFG